MLATTMEYFFEQGEQFIKVPQNVHEAIQEVTAFCLP